MLFLLLVLNILIIVLCFYSHHKIKKIHIASYETKNKIIEIENNLFKQIESLVGLYFDLKFEKSLPFTRGWAGSPDFLMTISRHVIEKKPEVILECSSGVSTVVLAQSLRINGSGHVYSIDHDPRFAEKTRQELIRHGLTDWATVIDGPLVKHTIDNKQWDWYSLENLPQDLSVDMLVIDGPPEFIGEMARYPAGPLLFEKLNKEAAVFLDDALRVDEKNILSNWLREYTDFKHTEIDCEKGCVMLTIEKI